MTTTVQARSRYENQRKPKAPPHISIRYLRTISGQTIDMLIAKIAEETGHRYSRGAISAVENGHRGASVELIEALEIAYGLPVGSIEVNYKARSQPETSGEDDGD